MLVVKLRYTSDELVHVGVPNCHQVGLVCLACHSCVLPWFPCLKQLDTTTGLFAVKPTIGTVDFTAWKDSKNNRLYHDFYTQSRLR